MNEDPRNPEPQLTEDEMREALLEKRRPELTEQQLDQIFGGLSDDGCQSGGASPTFKGEPIC